MASRSCAIGADLTQQTEAERLLQEVDEQLGGLWALRFIAPTRPRRLSRLRLPEFPWARPAAPMMWPTTVVFLASEYDGFISGATLDINGGVYAC